MIVAIIAIIVSDAFGIILFWFSNNKKLAVSLTVVVGILGCIATFVFYEDEKKTYENCYVPIFDYEISFSMTRADVEKILSIHNEYILGYPDEDTIAVRKEWLDTLGIAFFKFDEKGILEVVS